jgi:hypothetical protein
MLPRPFAHFPDRHSSPKLVEPGQPDRRLSFIMHLVGIPQGIWQCQQEQS